MRTDSPVNVFGKAGLRGILLDPVPRDPDKNVRIQIGDRRILEVAAGLLRPGQDGAYEIPFSPEDVRTIADESASTGLESSLEETVVPVIAEELDVHRRGVPTGGVRVHRRVLEDQEEIDMPLASEHVQVRRVLLDEDVEGPLPIRRDGDTIIIPIVEEVVVVSRKFRLKEEVHVTKTVREERYQERIPVRREEAVIEEIDADGTPSGRSLPETDARRPSIADEKPLRARRILRD